MANQSRLWFRPFSLLLLLVLARCDTPEATPTGMAQAVTLTVAFTPTSRPTATPTLTFTPAWTATPRPTHTPTASKTHTPTSPPPTQAPTATPTVTSTPVPPTAIPTTALPKATSTPQPPTATTMPEDGLQFDITMQRMLNIDENAGEVGNHNIYVHAFDANGNPLNGVVVCRVYALQLQPPDPHACGITGETGPGRMHFDVYSGDVVYVATKDPEHRPLSPYTRSLEQEPARMADLQELVDNGYCASIEDCERRIPINNLVRFHYSYEVHFTRRW
jgi:hypothetical protein